MVMHRIHDENTMSSGVNLASEIQTDWESTVTQKYVQASPRCLTFGLAVVRHRWEELKKRPLVISVFISLFLFQG